jgi:hypothetical protein
MKKNDFSRPCRDSLPACGQRLTDNRAQGPVPSVNFYSKPMIWQHIFFFEFGHLDAT